MGNRNWKSGFMNNPEYELKSCIEINDEVMYLSWEVKEKFIENDFNTNLAIAAFTTSCARVRLYEGLDHLGEQVLYFDTDSIVYYRDPKNPERDKFLVRGDKLGDMVSELDGSKICGIFAGAGPKNYSYETTFAVGKPKEILHTKVKGHNLNFSVSKKINHATIIETLQNKFVHKMKDDVNFIEVEYNAPKINGKNDGNYRSVYTKNQSKKYQVVYDKRVVLKIDEFGCIDTVPFGYEL